MTFQPETTWSIWTRRMVSLFLFLALIIALILTGPFLTSILLAGLLSLMLLLPIRLLVGTLRLPYGLATILVLLLYVGVVAILFYLLFVPVGTVLGTLLINLQALLMGFVSFLRQYTPVQGWIIDASGNQVINLNFLLDPLSRLVRGETALPLGQITPRAFQFLSGAAGSLGGILVNFVFIHLLAVYALFELPAGFRWWTQTLPPGTRREYAILFQRSGQVLGGYGRGIVLNTMISGTVAAILLLLFGVDGAISTALLATVFLLIPVIGGYIAGLLIFLAAFFTATNVFDLSPLLFALMVYLVYTVVQGGVIANFVEPWIYGSAVSIPITVILIGLAVAGLYAGFLGMVLTVPILGVLREVLTFVGHKLRGDDPYPNEPEPAYVTQSFLLDVG